MPRHHGGRACIDDGAAAPGQRFHLSEDDARKLSVADTESRDIRSSSELSQQKAHTSAEHGIEANPTHVPVTYRSRHRYTGGNLKLRWKRLRMRGWLTTFFLLVTGGFPLASAICRAMGCTSRVQISIGQSGFVAFVNQARVKTDIWYHVSIHSIYV